MKLFQRRKWCILGSHVEGKIPGVYGGNVVFDERYVYIPLWHQHNWVKWEDPMLVWDCSKCGWRKGGLDYKHEILSWPRQWATAVWYSAWAQALPSLWYWLRNVRCWHRWTKHESLFYFGGRQRQCDKCERWMWSQQRAQWTWTWRWWHNFAPFTRWHYGYINDAGW